MRIDPEVKREALEALNLLYDQAPKRVQIIKEYIRQLEARK